MPTQITNLVHTSLVSGVAFVIGIAALGLWLAPAPVVAASRALERETPGPRDLRRGGGRGRGFVEPVGEEPADRPM